MRVAVNEARDVRGKSWIRRAIGLAGILRRHRQHRCVHRQRNALGRRCVVRRVARRQRDREGLRPGGQHRAGCRSVYVRTCNRAGCIQLRRTQRRAIGDRRRRRPGNHRRRFVHRQRDGLGRRCIVGRVGRCQRDREGLRPGGQHRAGCRSVCVRTCNRAACIQLRRTQRGAVGDRRWSRPGNHRRRFVHRQRNALGRRCIVGRVARRQRDREGLRPSGQRRAGGRSVYERACNRAGCIQLCCAQRRTVSDRRWSRPGNHRRRFVHRQRNGLGRRCVVRRVARRQRDREGLRPGGQHRAGCRSVYVRTCNRAGCIQLRRTQRRAIGDRRRRRPGNHRRRFVHRQRDGLGRRCIVGRVGRCQRDREGLRPGGQHRAGCRSVCVRTCNRAACIQLRRTQRGAVGDRRWSRPGNHRRRFVHRQRNGLGRRCVVRRVARRQRDREGVSSGGGHRAGCRSVYVRACNRAGCIQLRRAERRAVGDRRRRRPGNHRRRLVHRQRAADIID